MCNVTLAGVFQRWKKSWCNKCSHLYFNGAIVNERRTPVTAWGSPSQMKSFVSCRDSTLHMASPSPAAVLNNLVKQTDLMPALTLRCTIIYFQNQWNYTISIWISYSFYMKSKIGRSRCKGFFSNLQYTLSHLWKSMQTLIHDWDKFKTLSQYK